MKLTKVIIAATCKTDGEGIFSCECGNAEERRVIPASVEYHDYQLKETTSAGIKIYVCNICNDTKIELPEGVSHVHDYKVISEKPAKCDEEGEIIKQCQNEGCDKETIVEKVAKIPHESDTKAGEGFVITPATTCGTDGEELVKCKHCGEEFRRVISAHDYDEGTVVLKATCTEKGTTKFTCKNCGATKYEDIKELGHDLGTAITLVAATCEKTGLSEKVCNRCGYEEKTTLKALGHVKPAEGTPEEAKVVYLDAKGKEVSDPSANSCKYTEALKYTCTNYDADSAQNKCNQKNGVVYEIVKKASGHAIDSSKVVAEGIATIDVNTVKNPVTGIYDYSDYDYVRNDDDDIVFEKGATVDCRHEKIKVFACANCGEEEVAVVVEGRKSHSGNVTTMPASCEEYGYTMTSCPICKQYDKVNVVKENTTAKPLGHNYAYIAETCTDDAIVKCTRCVSKYTEAEIKALVPESASGKNDNDQPIIALIDKALTNAKITHSGLNSTWKLGEKTGHNFVGKVTVDATDPTKATVYCDVCHKYITVKYKAAVEGASPAPAEISIDGDTATGTWTLTATNEVDAKKGA